MTAGTSFFLRNLKLNFNRTIVGGGVVSSCREDRPFIFCSTVYSIFSPNYPLPNLFRRSCTWDIPVSHNFFTTTHFS